MEFTLTGTYFNTLLTDKNFTSHLTRYLQDGAKVLGGKFVGVSVGGHCVRLIRPQQGNILFLTKSIKLSYLSRRTRRDFA